MQDFNAKQLHTFFQARLGLATSSDNTTEALRAVTVDTLVADVHFPQSTPPAWIAHKALAVNLSDLAAMGARPEAITIGLVLPQWDLDWLQAFSDGLAALVHAWSLHLLACDVCQGPLSVTIQAHGRVDQAHALTRAGAQPGDGIYVSGSVGDAACALPYYLANQALPAAYASFLQQRFNCPQPRVDVGLAIAGLATAAIDISDGLAADLGHILQESGVGARVDIDSLPASPALNHLLDLQQRLQCQLGGGDDYELCFTLADDKTDLLARALSKSDVTCTRIGEIVAGEGIEYFKVGKPLPLCVQGFDHFKPNKGV